jgi:hypothetical protein
VSARIFVVTPPFERPMAWHRRADAFLFVVRPSVRR